MEFTLNFDDMSKTLDRELNHLLTDSKNNQNHENKFKTNDTPNNYTSEFMQEEEY